jgi:hypothetical protein
MGRGIGQSNSAVQASARDQPVGVNLPINWQDFWLMNAVLEAQKEHGAPPDAGQIYQRFFSRDRVGSHEIARRMRWLEAGGCVQRLRQPNGSFRYQLTAAGQSELLREDGPLASTASAAL